MTDGTDLARRQLRELEEVAGGAVELVAERQGAAGSTFIVSLETEGIEQRTGGIKVRARERFEIWVPAGFPFELPSVWSAHRRWAVTSHVHFGRLLCLYAAPSVEWDPSDGMRGYIGRLTEWLERAAAGTLDPDGRPLHPPVAYNKLQAGRLIVHPDVGDQVPWAADGTDGAPITLFAWCVVEDRRVDLLEWIDLSTAYDRVLGDDSQLFHSGHPTLLMPAVMICDELGWEFPTEVKALSEGLAESGYTKDKLLSDIATATVINIGLRKKQVAFDAAAAGAPWEGLDDPDEDAPLFTAMVVGTPSRRVEGDRRLAHLEAWKLDKLGSSITTLFAEVRERSYVELTRQVEDLAYRWLDIAELGWFRIMEARPEVTRRRDEGTPAEWLKGKRVLVLGCGAVGAPIAEMCLRAGASTLAVADNGLVNPGILVRQPYSEDDIGKPKAEALAQRLSTLRTGMTVKPIVGNIRTKIFAPGQNLADYDLVIDATADAAARAVIEKARKTAAHRPPIVTMVIGHDAQRGLVTVNLRASSGAGADAFRKVALLAAAGATGWADIREDFFPATPRRELFFPEPGCSDPTFVGSAAQTTALAGDLLNEALMILACESAASDDGKTPEIPKMPAFAFASAIRLGGASTGAGTVRAEWASDLVETDPYSGYEVRITASVLLEARAEVRRGARIRGPHIETGGMLFGAFDDSTGIIYVDRLSGPPPDSYLSETYFQHGLEGVQERVEAERKRSADANGFVGFWHTHPTSRPLPSATDEQGMASVVAPDGTSRRALMVILGGGEGRWRLWRDECSGEPPEVYARVVPRSAGPVMAGHPGYVGGHDLQFLPSGNYYRGGYGAAVRIAHDGTVQGPGHQPVTHPARSWFSRILGGSQ